MARTTIRLGDVRGGAAAALALGDDAACGECAPLAAHQKAWTEAAALYEAAGFIEQVDKSGHVTYGENGL